MRKILIIGPSWVGDMVMSQGLYIELKKRAPEAKIDVLAPAWCKPILERMPQVNQALEMPLGHGQFDLKARYQIGKSLRHTEYDVAYVLPNSAKSALIPFFAKIPKRVGWKGEMRYGLLNDIRPNKKSFQYMLERYVALAHPKQSMTGSGCLGELSTLPYPALNVLESTQTDAMSKFGLNTDRPILGLCPGAEFGPAKRWPDNHFAHVATEMIKKGYQVWLFGSVKDKKVTTKIIEQVAKDKQQYCFNLAGDTSLIQAIDLIGACKTVVSNDSGLMHVAAAVGCNVVAVYGSSSPKYTPPLTKKLAVLNTDIDCRPCFQRTCPKQHMNCLVELMPERVVSAIEGFDVLSVG
ncbi:lipopolysaccharide heptosyltransferase II [Vibrio paucivorans]|uniref:lipopolysaccharide heptosyltransferase II n=1 Tax=Vibrio paucivorans TaxID=2829489 RepID=A0A9X3CEU1_9VIBR|nr:lipopolysaccharide heptosyltransferase II [Vibrio paucivorans]MCW8333605.1 lipopolysaccharide heptosyltransferase II [Vibrio paucivorans]